jgi:hypothetical protein
MSKWKLFGSSKSKEEEETENKELTANSEEIPETSEDDESESDVEPLAEYKETVYSSNSKSKKSSSGKEENPYSDQVVWRDVRAVEENIDNLHISKSRKPVSELDKKVDRLVRKNKRK